MASSLLIHPGGTCRLRLFTFAANERPRCATSQNGAYTAYYEHDRIATTVVEGGTGVCVGTHLRKVSKRSFVILNGALGCSGLTCLISERILVVVDDGGTVALGYAGFRYGRRGGFGCIGDTRGTSAAGVVCSGVVRAGPNSGPCPCRSRCVSGNRTGRGGWRGSYRRGKRNRSCGNGGKGARSVIFSLMIGR